jgi:hypothetical protein
MVQPSTAGKGKGKEIIIGDAREANGNAKIFLQESGDRNTPNGGDTMKITITTSNVGGRRRQATKHGLSSYTPRTVRRIDMDGPGHQSSGLSGNTLEQRPCTFKPGRPEIGTWKTNTFKASGQLVRSCPTFDQLLSKYVKKKARRSDRPTK